MDTSRTPTEPRDVVRPIAVFISYSSADRAEALAIRRLLTGRGCKVWLDVFDIRVSADLKHELGGGVDKADVLCLLLSPTAVASPWVAEEIARGEEHSLKRGLRMIAVLLRPCRPPDSLVGKVMLDATAGIASPDVSSRLARAVLGQHVVGDMEIDSAMQEALQARQNELEAANVLPELAQKLAEIRRKPIRRIRISFNHAALPQGKVLAVGLTFDRLQLFSTPMWFLFAHYREGQTWPKWMRLKELDYSRVRSDGKRVDGRFQWFDRVTELSEQLDGTDLRDLPATFDLELSGKSWTPAGSVAAYRGGPTVPHLAQKLEIPSLSELITKGATFGASLIGGDRHAEEAIEPEQNDLDIRVIASYESSSGAGATLFRSAHGPVGRAILAGAYLSNRKSDIEREAILGLYPRIIELESSERVERLEAARALRKKPDEQLSPEERRLVATQHYGQAQLELFRVFNDSPPPGRAQQKLHLAALTECWAVYRLLEPLIAASPQFDDVGMAYWAASNLAHYYEAGGALERARSFAEAAASLVSAAAVKVPDEPEYRRWAASALERLARIQAATGDRALAVKTLATSVDVLQALYEELANAGRRDDLLSALHSALQFGEGDRAVSATRRKRWQAMVARLESGAAHSRVARRAPRPGSRKSSRRQLRKR